MDQLNEMFSGILSDPEKMRQLQGIAASLGIGQSSPGEGPDAPTPPPAPAPAGGLDIGALSGLIQSLTGSASPSQSPAAPASSPDLSGLMSMLGGLAGSPAPSSGTEQTGGVDLSALSGLLRNVGASPAPSHGAGDETEKNGLNLSALSRALGGGAGTGGIPNIDMGMIAKLYQAMSTMNSQKQNVELLLALKGHLKTERSKKVDDAIRVMQVIQFLPLVKESGLFGGLDDVLGKLPIKNLKLSSLNLGGLNLGGIGQLLGGRR